MTSSNDKIVVGTLLRLRIIDVEINLVFIPTSITLNITLQIFYYKISYAKGYGSYRCSFRLVFVKFLHSKFQFVVRL